ncbi:hypothetical protein MASR2M15_04370 [Anaerolineales bacterium]
MPTPFTHLEIASRLLADPDLNPSARDFLNQYRPDFLLGSIIADARVGANIKRENTHFYTYDQPIRERPWRIMLKTYPALNQPIHEGHHAFIAGYVAHLATDEYWARRMVYRQFIKADWGVADKSIRWLALNLILFYMDVRDYERILPGYCASLCESHPQGWLPFLEDEAIYYWRDLVAHQLNGQRERQTLNIISEVLGLSPPEMLDMLSEENMQEKLWRYISMEALEQHETENYQFTLEQLSLYLDHN